jgi:hypothetical protein
MAELGIDLTHKVPTQLSDDDIDARVRALVDALLSHRV